MGLSSALAALAASFAWLLVCRALQAFGTSAAYPSGLAIFREQTRSGNPPAQALGAITIASLVSAALGPVLGGFLVALAGWPAIFWINLPVVALGLILAARWLPADPLPAHAAGPSAGRETLPTTLHALDLHGIVMFAALLGGLLGFLLSLARHPIWLLLPVAAVAAALLLLAAIQSERGNATKAAPE